MTTFIESQKANTGGVAYEVILKPAAGDGPRPSSPPKDKNITHNDIVKKLQEAEERRQVRIRTSPMTARVFEILCPTCPTWSHFTQDKLEISINLSWGKLK